MPVQVESTRKPTKVFALAIHPEMVEMAKTNKAAAACIQRVKSQVSNFKGSSILLPSDTMSDGKFAFEVSMEEPGVLPMKAMQVLIYNEDILFNQYTSLMAKMKTHQSLLQNNMVITHQASVEWLNEFDSDMDKLRMWRDRILNTFHCNLISPEDGATYTRLLEENCGNIPEKE